MPASEIDILANRRCPACDCESLRTYIEAPETTFDVHSVGSSRASFAHGRVLQCTRCGHGFRERQPTYAQLAEAYRRMDVSEYEGESRSRLHTARRHAAMLTRLAGPAGKVLDVGCASGLFLQQARENGWQVCGVEPCTTLAFRAAERLGTDTIVNQTLEESELPLHSFDAITLWDLLEHVASPSACLSRCADLLRDHGAVLLKVPDLESLIARIMGRRWPLLLPEHLNYFTRSSLRALSECTGFRPELFYRSPVAFSLSCILLRLRQHKIPGMNVGHRLLHNSFIGKLRLSFYLGELYATLKIAPQKTDSKESP